MTLPRQDEKAVARAIVDRTLARLRELHDYASRPAWEQVIAEEIEGALRSTASRARAEGAEAMTSAPASPSGSQASPSTAPQSRPAGSDPSRDARHPALAFYDWLAREYREPDPTTGWVVERAARKLWEPLCEFIGREVDGYAPSSAEEGDDDADV